MKSWEVVDAARLVTLLTNVAPLVMPWISGRVISNLTAGESYESFWAWRRAHNPLRLMREGSFTEADMRRWHTSLAIDAYGVDPLRQWFDLTQNIAWRQWDRVEGKPRLAHDLYTMAQIIRHYAKEFLHTDLPEEDEVWHGPMSRKVKERDYGHPLVTGRRRDVRRRVARKFGLDGGVRVVWFVEGPTEKAFATKYSELRGYSCEQQGIAVEALHGEGTLSRRGKSQPLMRERLEEAGREDQFTYVTPDALPDRTPELRQLARDHLITAGFDVWQSDFEDANFSDDELAKILTEAAAVDGVELRITGSQITAERQRGASTHDSIKRRLRGQVWEAPSGERWGTILGEWAVSHPCPSAIGEDGVRPVVGVFRLLIRGCISDYLGSIENYRVGDDGKIVER